jgi:hypothetical protein
MTTRCAVARRTLQTGAGIAVGSTMHDVREAYGNEESLESGEDGDILVYDSQGVAFVVDKDGALEGRISRIHVFWAGRVSSDLSG